MNGSALLACGVLAVAAACASAGAGAVERWGRFEWTGTAAKAHESPFTDVELSCTFTRGKESVTVAGFCDGPKTYKVRFMPPTEGTWRFKTRAKEVTTSFFSLTLRLLCKARPGPRGDKR